MKTALLISTYNWPNALELVLKSVQNQTQLPNEILIADDGSTKETKALIDIFSKKIDTSVKHFWQDDKGFRKSKILNKAIAETDADYIIQADGDCILDKNFVKDHITNAKSNVYLYGSRVNILPDFVNEIFRKKKITFNLFSKEIKNKTRTLYFPFLAQLYKPHQGISKKFRGCNVSYWRKDFIEINGYNEDFEGWGREDSDLVIRMGNKGVLAKRLRYAGIVFHIFHKTNSKHNLELNNAIEQKTILEKTIRIENGVHQYLSR
ncbi:glycosyltransferase [Flavobacterium sp. NST-5]|uniref:Glycosyltransferase n=1 Tax=Flavobacterium ichthyis TaxID=2698827 RepID=A0ABW9Z9M8_9FLAO|nr:glycosyltransferase family 2 protein [Flavobacterium ichthyis]NBL65272.1 glycosyltransferase [Flavobacterium ichthyis]